MGDLSRANGTQSCLEGVCALPWEGVCVCFCPPGAPGLSGIARTEGKFQAKSSGGQKKNLSFYFSKTSLVF